MQIDLMLNSGNLSHTSLPHSCKLAEKAHDVLSGGFLLTSSVCTLYVVFCVRIGLLRAVLVRTRENFGRPSTLLGLE